MRQRVPTSILFFTASFIWGTTWLVIKYKLGSVAPEVSVVYRFSLAALALFAWCVIRRVRLAFDARAHASIALLGALQFGAPYVLVYRSERRLTSGLVAVVFALVVLWNIVGERLVFRGRLPAAVLTGAALGILGVVLLFWPELARFHDAPGERLGVALAVLATFVASAGNLWAQRVYALGIAVVPSTAWGMLYSSIAVALYCVVCGIPFAYDPSLPYVASLAYLALFGSVVAFIAYLTLLQRRGAARAGYTGIVIPVLAMATSTVFEGYRWSSLALVGMLLVLAGSTMVLRGRQRALR
jgi:drug/metabolite transporter (DMT)-like permease